MLAYVSDSFYDDVWVFLRTRTCHAHLLFWWTLPFPPALAVTDERWWWILYMPHRGAAGER